MIDRGQAGRRDRRALAYSKMTSADGYKWRECWSCKLSACDRHAGDQYKQKSSVGTKLRRGIVMTSGSGMVLKYFPTDCPSVTRQKRSDTEW